MPDDKARCGPLQKPFGFVIGDFGAAVEAAMLTQTLCRKRKSHHQPATVSQPGR
jgi:hypothetical protein